MTYESFINDILATRGRFACGNTYHERHHIKPKSCGGTNDEDNIIDLYAREHFIAHQLLARENPDNDKLQYAYAAMAFMSNEYEERCEITPEEYEDARIALSSMLKRRYYDGTKMASWVPKSKLYVRDFKDNNRIVISTLKEGAITGTVFASDLVLVEAAQKTEDKPVEVKPAVKLPGTPSTGSKADEKALWDFLLAKIGNEYGVAGLMGNLYAESALRSNNLQNTYEKSLGYTDEGYTAVVDDGSYTNFIKDSAGYGLAQWTFWSRKQGLFEYAKSVGKSIGDFTMQMEFLWKELSGNHKATLNALKSAQNVTEASTYVLIHFEAPADQGEAVQAKRASYGEKYYNAYHIVVEESKEEIEETIPEENTNQNDTNDGSVDKPVETPAGEDVTTEVENEPEYIQTPEEAQNFLMRLLNHVIDFIVRLFKK